MAEPPKICPRCKGTGTLPTADDMTVQQCICAYSRALKLHLGAEIATAPVLRSPLLQLGPPGEPPKVDRTSENLFLKGYWPDLLSHLKWALGCKGPLFRFRVVTDEKLKVVYLGAESYGARAKGRRDEVTTFNSLSDLVGPDIDLLILRLGFLGYKNQAMAGILKEALMIREFACKPTWIVEVPTSPFGPGHFSYSEEVGDYIAAGFQIVDLTRKESARKDAVPHGFEMSPLAMRLHGDEDSDEDIGLGGATLGAPTITPEVEQFMPKPRFKAPAAPSLPEEMSLPGEGRSERKPSWKGKKKPSGGGPV